MGGGKAALVIGGTGQCRPANHITGSIDMGNFGLVVLVDLDLATLVIAEANLFKAEIFGIPCAAIGPEQRFTMDTLAGFKLQGDAVFMGGYPLVLLVVTHHHIEVPQVVAEGIGDFIVEKAHQPLPGVDQVNPGVEAGEDRGVLTADYTGTVDNNISRCVVEAEYGVAIKNIRVVEIDILRAVGTGSGGQQEVAALRFVTFLSLPVTAIS